ncbi:MAG: outer membrane protein transport protein, partial [Myxococcales bacterium]|nr:outer membrane protein transport protein [Myxococcales bacterium]
RNGDGSDDLVNRTPRTDDYAPGDPQFFDNIKEGRGLVDLSSWDLAASFGVVYQPTDELYIGLSYQSQPGFGEQELAGTAKKVLANSDSVTDDATATQSMPDVIRWGLRYNYGKGEARLFGDYARWSLFEKQCISTKGRDDCDLANIPRNWEDAFSVRFGYSYFMNDMIELYFGGGYDGNAVPDEYLEPALYDAEKFSGAFGGRFTMLDGALAIAATYTQIFYIDRETDAWPRDPATGALIPQGDFRTAFNPNSAGKYSQAIGVFNLNAQYAF